MNGSLVDRRLKPGELFLGQRTRSLSAAWCGGRSPIVFYEGDDLEIHAFQYVTTKTSLTESTSTWTTLGGNFGGIDGITSAVNFDSVCGFSGADTVDAIMFINGIANTGHLDTIMQNSKNYHSKKKFQLIYEYR